MNRVHRVYCRSRHWRRHLQRVLGPATDGLALREASVLELGSGPGLTTDWLLPRVAQLTCVDIDADDAAALAARLPKARVVHADATSLPFAPMTFDVVLSFTMLHHLPDSAAQTRLFAEARRVLRPGGVFAGIDSVRGVLFALAHVGDTMTLIPPEDFPERLRRAGLERPTVSKHGDHVRFRAWAPA